MILAHTIEAMVGDKPARVHCNTCKAQHSYKPHKPGEGSRTGRARKEGSATGATPRKRGNQYQELLKDKNMAHVKRYSPKDKYSPGDVVEHPTFGIGVARSPRDGTKIEVLFEDGLKVLVQGG